MSDQTPSSENDQTPSSENVQKNISTEDESNHNSTNEFNEILTHLGHAEKSREQMNDTLLRTVKYTGETNKQLMDVLGTVMEMVADQQKLFRNQHKHNKMKLFMWALPVFFFLFFMAKEAWNEQAKYKSPTGYVAQVSITGTIAAGSPTASADAVIPALRKAFEDKMAKGVLIKISSPGGSPAQAHLIY